MADSALTKVAEHTRHRFVVLDAMRGVAALTVVTLHGASIFGWPVIPRAYLAVDFFFFLSGFIMQYTYAGRLASGWSPFSFLRARFVRLYPIYFLAMLVAAAPAVAVSTRLPFLHLARSFWPVFLAGLAVVPVTSGWAAFPLNGPAWSLFCEGAANILHGFVLRRLRIRSLVAVMCLCGGAFVWHTVQLGTPNFGSSAQDLPAAVARAVFAYILGMLLHGWWSRVPRSTDIPALVPVVALLAVLFTPMWGHPLISLVDVALLFPIFLIMGAMATGSAAVETFSEWLGSISYPVYLLHVPVLWLFHSVLVARFHAQPNTRTMTVLGILAFLTVIAASWLAAAFYDPFARSALNRLLPGRKHLPHAPRP
jgi:peptidoglycan/LPS O-acetylase OafA/YrhL